MELILLVHATIIITINAIDINERLGTCIPNFTNNVNYYINANEGTWFPQYRTSADYPDIIECHTIYENVVFDQGFPKLEMDSYHTTNGIVIKDVYRQTFSKGEQRGLLIDTEYVSGHGDYKIFNYILKLTPEFRVRYVCTDFQGTIAKQPTLYIETKSTRPSYAIIKKAVRVLSKAGFSVKLDKIRQTQCNRPLSSKGYVDIN